MLYDFSPHISEIAAHITLIPCFTQKGFGDETPTLQAELEEYFNKFGRINAVRMRRDQEKKFKVFDLHISIVMLAYGTSGICLCRVL